MKLDYFQNERGDITITLDDELVAICESVEGAIKLVNAYRAQSMRIDTLLKMLEQVDPQNKVKETGISKFINLKVFGAVKEAHDKTNGRCIFCGSLGLVLNGVLNREVADVDVLTEICYYGYGSEEANLNKHSSGRFVVNGKEVLCTTAFSESGVKIDYLFRNDYENITFTTINFNGLEINVETPEQAIKAKKAYAHSNSELFLKNVAKHNQDLSEIADKYNDDDLPF